jgi:hypothetical protein
MQIPEMILDVAARSRDMKPSNIISTAEQREELARIPQKSKKIH